MHHIHLSSTTFNFHKKRSLGRFLSSSILYINAIEVNTAEEKEFDSIDRATFRGRVHRRAMNTMYSCPGPGDPQNPCRTANSVAYRPAVAAAIRIVQPQGTPRFKDPHADLSYCNFPDTGGQAVCDLLIYANELSDLSGDKYRIYLRRSEGRVRRCQGSEENRRRRGGHSARLGGGAQC